MDKIKDTKKVTDPNTQKEETDNKPTYTNDQILEKIENAYRQDREIDNSISPDELWSAIENIERYCYYSVMLSSEKYSKTKKYFSPWERLVIFFYWLIPFKLFTHKLFTHQVTALSNNKYFRCNVGNMPS